MSNNLAKYIHIVKGENNRIRDDGSFIYHLRDISNRQSNQPLLQILHPVNYEKDFVMIQYLKDVVNNDENNSVILLTSAIPSHYIIIFRRDEQSLIGTLDVVEDCRETFISMILDA